MSKDETPLGWDGKRLVDYSQQKAPDVPVIQQGTNPWTSPPIEEIPMGTVIEPDNPAPVHVAVKITTSASDGTPIHYGNQLVGYALDGVVVIAGNSDAAQIASKLVRDGVLTEVKKGVLC